MDEQEGVRGAASRQRPTLASVGKLVTVDPGGSDSSSASQRSPMSKSQPLTRGMSLDSTTSPISGTTQPAGRQRRQFVRLRNLLTGTDSVDTLHQSGIMVCPVSCTSQRCVGSLMMPTGGDVPPKRPHGVVRPSAEVKEHAEDFLMQYYSSLKSKDSKAHLQRLAQVLVEIEERGTYDLTEKELVFGAKTAWRNAVRCIGRIQWNRLQMFDCRHITTAQQMHEVIRRHIMYGNNEGNIRSAITVFPQREHGLPDFRVWNPQYFKYAGFKQEDGSIVGDPSSVEFTDICKGLGWQPASEGPFVFLPLVVQARGQPPEIFDVSDLALEVEITHPEFEWFAELGLKWYCLPAVTNMLFDCGGIEFPAAPFSGWYMGSEVARDLCDENRYNILPEVAQRMGLNTKSNSALWKDKAFVEVNIAVLHSFQKSTVTISDHHSASESFLKHMDNEFRLRGGCPTDWVWVNPPISSSTTGVYHQEMLNYQLRPSYEYQTEPWKLDLPHKMGDRKDRFRRMANIVRRFTAMFRKSLARRVKATVLFATETGRSQTYARKVAELFSYSFEQKVVCMDEYNARELEHEQLVIIVTSTFGNGEPPDNGVEFAKVITEMCNSADSESSVGEEKVYELVSDPSQWLANVKFSVFGLGSRAYPNFCAFAKQLDSTFEQLGGERILEMGEGDELCGQEEAFLEWLKKCYQSACQVFSIDEGDKSLAEKALQSMPDVWSADLYRVRAATDIGESSSEEDLSNLHRKKIATANVISVENLQSSGAMRSTILVKMKTNNDLALSYEPGDHLGVCASNDEREVNDILQSIATDVDHDTPVVMETKQRDESGQVVDSFIAEKRFPRPCSLREALTYFLDVLSPPNPQMISLMVKLATDGEEKERLELLSKGSSDYEDWKFEKFPTFSEFLKEFKSLKIPPSLLLSQLPILQPRYYSISSCPRLNSGEVHLTVAVVCYTTQADTTHHGLCSTWLSKKKAGDEVPCFVRKAPSFHMPSDISAPVYMIGPGTGIAPFRSFWQHRHYLRCSLAERHPARSKEQRSKSVSDQDETASPWGRMKLFFGCRFDNIDNIYKKELADYMLNGTLQNVSFAFSRDPNHPKQYVQDRLEAPAEAQQLLRDIYEEGGHIYVCGDVSMADRVGRTVQNILETYAAMATDEARAYIANMKASGHYHEDIFGVTLKTQEVTDQRRAAAKRIWKMLRTPRARSKHTMLMAPRLPPARNTRPQTKIQPPRRAVAPGSLQQSGRRMTPPKRITLPSRRVTHPMSEEERMPTAAELEET